MKIQTMLAGILLACFALTIPTLADSVKSDYSQTADFAQLHSYSWGDVKTANPLYVDRVKRAVNQALQSKGWKLLPNGGDTTVFANGNIRNEQQLETFYNDAGSGWGGGWGWGGWGRGRGGGFGTSTSRTVSQPVGNLVIDIFASSDKKLIWRGMIERDIDNDAEDNIKDVNKDIAKLFKKFPPKGES